MQLSDPPQQTVVRESGMTDLDSRCRQVDTCGDDVQPAAVVVSRRRDARLQAVGGQQINETATVRLVRSLEVNVNIAGDDQRGVERSSVVED